MGAVGTIVEVAAAAIAVREAGLTDAASQRAGGDMS